MAGRLPDRVVSIPVALVSMAVDATGQLLLWRASSPVLALAGAALTGLGCSLMFPAMGIEVVRRACPSAWNAAGGLAMFEDIALGATAPVTGLLADRFGYGAVFLVGGVAAALGLLLVVWLARDGRRARATQAPHGTVRDADRGTRSASSPSPA